MARGFVIRAERSPNPNIGWFLIAYEEDIVIDGLTQRQAQTLAHWINDLLNELAPSADEERP